MIDILIDASLSKLALEFKTDLERLDSEEQGPFISGLITGMQISAPYILDNNRIKTLYRKLRILIADVQNKAYSS